MVEKYLVYIALFAPLFGSLFVGIFYARSPKNIWVGIFTSTLLCISFLASFLLLIIIFNSGAPVHVNMMEWINAGNLNIVYGFLVDEISVTMMLVVTLVSTVVHIYSIGYMDNDKSFNRFFSYLSAFVFSMLVLVMSDNFAGLFIGWEGVGVCSWLLIGFWYHKKDVSTDKNPAISPSYAANEAFIMNRIADLGMLIGIFIIYWNVGSLKYVDLFNELPNLTDGVLVAIGITLFIGAMGKSAQFPLHTWLTDAMEGPTPVSALIHAATMVTAGVFLIIRTSPVYDSIPSVGLGIAIIGTFVAFFAASMALVNRDLKRIIAYSTLSQLGYMFAAVGLGAYWIALFHLAAHAFFKALLFLGAGNVMHAMSDELDLFKMGGLKKVMRGTYLYMGIASIALAGLPFFAGFYSKDAIIETAFNEGTYMIWFVLVLTAGMTAFYSFRQVFLTFHGEERYKEQSLHPHEMYRYVLIAMSPLAILAIITGFFQHQFQNFISTITTYEMSEHTHHLAPYLGGIVVTIALIGIIIAYLKYGRVGKKSFQESDKIKKGFFYKLLINQYYIPHFYYKIIIKPYKKIADICWKIDLKIVDATVDGIAKILYNTGDYSRKMQNGNLSSYLNWMGIGVVILIIIITLLDPFLRVIFKG